MYEAESMDVVDGRCGLGHVELGHVLAERVLLDEERHHVAAGQKLHDQVEIARVLERVEHLDDPLVVGLGEYVAFGAHVRHLLLEQHVLLAQYLHGVDVAGVLLLHEAHLAERALADHLDGREVVVGELEALEAQELGLLERVQHAAFALLLLAQHLQLHLLLEAPIALHSLVALLQQVVVVVLEHDFGLGHLVDGRLTKADRGRARCHITVLIFTAAAARIQLAVGSHCDDRSISPDVDAS